CPSAQAKLVGDGVKGRKERIDRKGTRHGQRGQQHRESPVTARSPIDGEPLSCTHFNELPGSFRLREACAAAAATRSRLHRAPTLPPVPNPPPRRQHAL